MSIDLNAAWNLANREDNQYLRLMKRLWAVFSSRDGRLSQVGLKRGGCKAEEERRGWRSGWRVRRNLDLVAAGFLFLFLAVFIHVCLLVALRNLKIFYGRKKWSVSVNYLVIQVCQFSLRSWTSILNDIGHFIDTHSKQCGQAYALWHSQYSWCDRVSPLDFLVSILKSMLM